MPDLRQFKGPFGETFARMHPVLADRFTKLRYGTGGTSDSVESVYGDDHVYTQVSLSSPLAEIPPLSPGSAPSRKEDEWQ